MCMQQPISLHSACIKGPFGMPVQDLISGAERLSQVVAA